MKIYTYELTKIFRNRMFLVFLVVLFALNGFFMYNSQIKGNSADFISADAKIALHNDIKDLSDNEKIRFINNKLDSVYDADYTYYTDNSYSERMLLNNTLEYVRIISDYSGYINSILDESSNMSEISLFADSNSYSYKNRNKTAEDFKSNLTINTVYDISDGVNSATDFMLTDFFALIMIFVICDIFVSADRTINITGLLKVCKNGKYQLIVNRLLAMTSVVFVICMLFYGTNILIASHLYGMGDLFRSIQSVNVFQNCILKINILGYLIVFVAAKFVIMTVLCFTVSLISMLAKSKTGSYVIVFVITGIFLAVYSVVQDNSPYMAFKYINSIAFLDVKNIIGHYLNINIFGHPINYIAVFIVTSIFMLMTFSVLNTVVFVSKTNWRYNAQSESKVFRLNLPFEKTSVIRHEMYKLFVSNKVCWILIIVILFQLLSVIYSPISLNEDEKYEKYYFQTISSKSIVETEEMLTSFDNVEEYNLIQRCVVPYYDYLSEQKSFGKDVTVVFYQGYNVLLGVKGSASDTYTLLLYILITICTVPLFTKDYEIKTATLLRSTKTGIKKISSCKFMSAFVVTVLLNILVYLPFVLRVGASYGLQGIKASICSIPEFSNLPDSISILQILIISFTVRLVISLFVVAIIGGFCLITKNTTIAFSVSVILFVIPILLPLNEINILNNYSLYYLQTFGKILTVGT